MNKIEALKNIEKKYEKILEEAEDSETKMMAKGVLHEVKCLLMSHKEKIYYGDPI